MFPRTDLSTRYYVVVFFFFFFKCWENVCFFSWGLEIYFEGLFLGPRFWVLFENGGIGFLWVNLT